MRPLSPSWLGDGFDPDFDEDEIDAAVTRLGLTGSELAALVKLNRDEAAVWLELAGIAELAVKDGAEWSERRRVIGEYFARRAKRLNALAAKEAASEDAYDMEVPS